MRKAIFMMVDLIILVKQIIQMKRHDFIRKYLQIQNKDVSDILIYIFKDYKD